MRESDAKDQGGFIDTKNNMTLLQPANFAHSGNHLPFLYLKIGLHPIDQGPSSVLKRIKTQLPDEAESLLNDRIRVLKYAWPFMLNQFQSNLSASGNLFGIMSKIGR
jgi:hypothetical protein